MGYITGVEKLKSLNVSPARLKVSDKSSTSILKSSITKHRDSLPPRRGRELTVASEEGIKLETFQFIYMKSSMILKQAKRWVFGKSDVASNSIEFYLTVMVYVPIFRKMEGWYEVFTECDLMSGCRMVRGIVKANGHSCDATKVRCTWKALLLLHLLDTKLEFVTSSKWTNTS